MWGGERKIRLSDKEFISTDSKEYSDC